MNQVRFLGRLVDIGDSFAIQLPIQGSTWIDTPLTPAQARLAVKLLRDLATEIEQENKWPAKK